MSRPDRLATRFSEVCDVVERTYQGWPLEPGPDEAPLLHTSAEARAAAMRIFEILGIRCDPNDGPQ